MIMIMIATAAALFAAPAEDARLANPFFAFDNGVGRGQWTPEEQAAVLDELGYAGIGYTGTADLTERLKAFDERGLEVFSLYVACHVDKDTPYDAQLAEAILRLKGRDVMLWLTVQGQADNDEKAVAVVGEIAGLAEASGLKVALYPHAGFHVATVDDALRVAKKVQRENVGVTFNLCHELKAGNEERFDEIIKKAMPHLFLVSINGANHEGGWDLLIQTLDRGVFDVYALLKKIESAGYRGPIGLQCYNVKGDIRDNLARSMAAWNGFRAQMKKEGK